MLIQANALQGFAQVVCELGGNPDEFIRDVGLEPATLTASENRMPVIKFAELLNLCAEKLNCPDFGIRLGSTQDFDSLGSLGVLMQHCQTVREASKISQGYMAYHNQSEVWTTKESGDIATLFRYDMLRHLPLSRQYAELAFAVCIAFFRLVLGGKLEGFRLQLSHSAIASEQQYWQYLGIPVEFSCEHDCLIYPRSILERPISEREQATRRHAQQQVQHFHQSYQQNIVDTVSGLIQQLMGTGQVSIEQIAVILHTHKRTLQRKLKAQNVVFKNLLEEVRMSRACWYLECSDIDITLLSQVVGYGETGNFSRAFKKAKGVSPREWRKVSKT